MDTYRVIAKTSTGTRLKELLKENNMTGAYLAANLKNTVSPQTVSAWLNDKSMPIRSIKDLAEFFEVDEDYILCKQIERHKKDNLSINNFNYWNEVLEAFIPFLNVLGYDILPSEFETKEKNYKYMADDNTEAEISIESKERISSFSIYSSKYSDFKNISSEDLKRVVDQCIEYIKFSFEGLKGNNSEMR